MSKNKTTRMRIEAEYKARCLFVDLEELAAGDTSLLATGLSVAFGIVKGDLLSLIPQPPAPPAAAPPAPAAPAPVVKTEEAVAAVAPPQTAEDEVTVPSDDGSVEP